MKNLPNDTRYFVFVNNLVVILNICIAVLSFGVALHEANWIVALLHCILGEGLLIWSVFILKKNRQEITKVILNEL